MEFLECAFSARQRKVNPETRTDRTTRISSAVASPLTTKHAAKRSVFVNLKTNGNLKKCSRIAITLYQVMAILWVAPFGIACLIAAHIRKSRPDSGLGFQVRVRENFKVVPFLLR